MQILNLFIGTSGAPADLFTFTMPTISYKFFKHVNLITVPIPPFGPILTANLGVEGGIAIEGNLTVGYDTKRFREFQADPSKPNRIFDGSLSIRASRC